MSITLAALLAASAPTASAQTTNTTWPPEPTTPQAWHDQRNELGSALALYQDVIDGEPKPLEARFYLKTHYNARYAPDKGVTYFLFALDTQRVPLRATFDSLVDDTTGAAIPVYKKEVEANGHLEKWFVDAANMPTLDHAIVVRATIHAQDEGQYAAGVLLQPFNYRWEPVTASSGTPAQLYIFTQYGVNQASERAPCDGVICPALELVRGTPAPAPLALAAAVAVGALLAGRRVR